MMICSRTKNEGFIINDSIFVTVVEIHEDEVVLAIDAPDWVRVCKREDLETAANRPR